MPTDKPLDNPASIKGLLVDLSGVVHQGDAAVPGSRDALVRLRDAGLPVRFVSNTSRKTCDLLYRQLHELGFDIERDQLFTAPVAARQYYQQHAMPILALVHESLRPEFDALQLTDDPAEARAVLVGDAAEGFSYTAMNLAFRALQEGAELHAIARNRYFRDGDRLSLDAGAFVAALEYASGRTAQLFGKPATAFFEQAVASLGLAADDVLMVGDDVEADVNGALDAGLQAVLVRTGKYQAGDDDRNRGSCLADLQAVTHSLLD
ncbi:MAG: TIGR01458 family HAD-type hydrolase [Gammaproteobacteria bacterium]|nr:TIGR01458 family HAD-type hydrolase [Gammaproteobacteria bacterium]